jgi:hypothetical protein
MTRLTKLKGFKVTKSKSGKTILEPIPCYGKDASARIAAKKKVRIARRAPG